MILADHSCGLCSVLPNLLSGFGWNPGRKILRWFGETLEKKTGNADITFMDVIDILLAALQPQVLFFSGVQTIRQGVVHCRNEFESHERRIFSS